MYLNWTQLLLLLSFGTSSIWTLRQSQGQFSALRSSSKSNPGQSGAHCEPIEIQICRGIEYNETFFPNLMGNLNQEQAGQDMNNFYPLIKIQCSPDIHLFLCLIYAPVCTILDYPLPPCRDLCESARSGCEHLMLQFGYPWPKELDCAKFPVSGNPDELCVGETNHSSSNNNNNNNNNNQQFSNNFPIKYRPSTPRPVQEGSMKFQCPPQLSVDPDMDYKLQFDDFSVSDCGMPCYNNVTFFDSQQMSKMRVWILSWSIVCLISCLFTLSTFAVDKYSAKTDMFPYPERPIVFIAMCFAVISVVLIVGYAVGEDIVCNKAYENRTGNYITEMTVKQGSVEDWRCTLTAMILYFFLTAGSLWWVILTVAWFLEAVLKWGQEPIEAKAPVFHVVAWMVPFAQTVVILVMKKVEGDVMSGVCFVGIFDSRSLLLCVFVPLAVYLSVGFVLLIWGFFSLVHIRYGKKMQFDKQKKYLEDKMRSIGIFAVLYILPAGALLFCYFYEYAHLPKWMSTWQEDLCRYDKLRREWQIPCRISNNEWARRESAEDILRPNIILVYVKYFSVLLIGILSGFWVWNQQMVNTWRAFFVNISGGNDGGKADSV